jgi:hypothetical protein
MAEPPDTRLRPGTGRAAAWLAAAVLVAGVLLLIGSYLLHKERPIAGTPAPRALFHATIFSLPPRQSACMSPLTFSPKGRTLALQFGETSAAGGSPPIDVRLTAPGYRASAHVAGGSEEQAQVPVHSPRRFVIGSACLTNRGTAPALLAGSTELRSRSRVAMTIGGRPVAGDIALTFLANKSQSRLSRIGEVFEHASILTDRLIPVWLVWIIAVLTVLSVPLATVALFYRALREDGVA